MIRKFFKDGAVYAVAGFFSKGLSLILLPFYVRVIAIEDYGMFDLVLLLANFVNLTFSLELSQALARYIPGINSLNLKRHYVSSALWLSVLTYLIFFIIYFLFRSTLSQFLFNKSLSTTTFLLTALYIVSNGLFLFTQNNLRWQLKSVQYSWISVCYTFLTAATTIVLIIVFDLGLNGVLLGGIFGAVISSLLSIFNLRDMYSPIFYMKHVKKMVKFSFPLIFSSIAVYFSLYVDRLFINKYLGLEEVAIFGVGYRFASMLYLLTTGFSTALVPLIYSKVNDVNISSNLNKLFELFLTAGFCIVMALYLFSGEILFLFTTEAYQTAAILIPLLSLSVFISTLYMFFPGVSIAKKTILLAVINAIVAIVNVGLCLFLVKSMGVIGAAIATLISAIFGFFINAFFSFKYFKQPIAYKKVVYMIVFVLLTLILTRFVFSALQQYEFVWSIMLSKLLFYMIFVFSFVGLFFREAVEKGINLLKERIR